MILCTESFLIKTEAMPKAKMNTDTFRSNKKQTKISQLDDHWPNKAIILKELGTTRFTWKQSGTASLISFYWNSAKKKKKNYRCADAFKSDFFK